MVDINKFTIHDITYPFKLRREKEYKSPTWISRMINDFFEYLKDFLIVMKNDYTKSTFTRKSK